MKGSEARRRVRDVIQACQDAGRVDEHIVAAHALVTAEIRKPNDARDVEKACLAALEILQRSPAAAALLEKS